MSLVPLVDIDSIGLILIKPDGSSGLFTELQSSLDASARAAWASFLVTHDLDLLAMGYCVDRLVLFVPLSAFNGAMMSEAYFAIPCGLRSAACPRVLDGAFTYYHTRKNNPIRSVAQNKNKPQR